MPWLIFHSRGYLVASPAIWDDYIPDLIILDLILRSPVVVRPASGANEDIMFEEKHQNSIRTLLERENHEELRSYCFELHPQAIADEVSQFESTEIWEVLTLLPLANGVEIFSHLPLEQQVELVSGQTRQKVARLIEEMAPDDRADLVQRLDPQVQADILPLVARAEREDIRKLVSYAEGTAGAVMSTDYAVLRPEHGINEALGLLRTQASVTETIYYVYIVDDLHRLTGFVSLKDLILAKPTQTVADVMHSEVLSINVEDDQEEAARKIEKYGLIAIPVIDTSETLVGIITHDDAMDILDKEQGEDLLAFGGVSAEEEGDVTPYWQSGFAATVKRRISWLLMLFLAEGVTGNVLRHYQWVEMKIPDLSLFIPLLIGTGGNAGSQTVSTIIRGLATGEIETHEALKVLIKEVITGFILGVMLGSAGFLYAHIVRGQSFEFCAVIGLSILGICTWANNIGALVPIVAKSFGIDPAVVSAPLISTLVDATGLIIYYSVAIAVLLQVSTN